MRRLLALGIILSGAGISGVHTASAETYLIVPFQNVARNSSLDWIGESLAEMVREALASHEVSVIGRRDRESAASRLGIRPGTEITKASLMRWADEGGAGYVIFGSFEYLPARDSEEPARGSLRIVARSIDIAGTAAGPSWEEEGLMADLSQLQTRLAWRILRTAISEAAPREKEFFESHPPVRIDAMENYIRGLLAAEPSQRHRLFTLAVNLEPEFSPPIFQLGRMHWEEKSYRVSSQWLVRVKPSDSHYVEANFLLGLCRYHLGDYAGALAAFEMVARAAPTDLVYNNIGLAQYRLGIPEALESLRWASERQPADPDYHFNLGYMLWREGAHESAAKHLRAAIEFDPGDAEARRILERCESGDAHRRSDLSSEGLERLKENYEELSARSLAPEEYAGGSF